MTQLIPEQWLSMESSGFDKLLGITTRCCDAFERLTALNLQAIRFGLAETQEALARTCVANNLPEMLSLPVLLAPVGSAQTQSYCRQFFGIMSDLQWDWALQQPVCAVRQAHFMDNPLGGLATQPRVPCDVPATPAMPPAPAAAHGATATTEFEKRQPGKKTIQPMHTE